MATSLSINDIFISFRRASNTLVSMTPDLYRGFLLGYLHSIHGHEGTSYTAEMRMRVASLTRAREVEGSAWSGQRGQDKLQSNPREPARGQLQFVARPQEEKSGARGWSAHSKPPAYEALRQMSADRETLVSLKRAAEKTRRSTTSTDRDRCASPSSGARCRHASKTISNKLDIGIWMIYGEFCTRSILSWVFRIITFDHDRLVQVMNVIYKEINL